MPTLTAREIEQAIEDGDIVLNPFDETNLEPASIDLTLGNEAFLASDDDKTFLDEGSVLTLPPGEMSLVLTRENLSLGLQYAATIGLRSKFARKGVDLLAGPQVDPGFQGPLHIALINLSPSQQVIENGEAFLTLEIHRLSEEAGERYSGDYQAQSTITSKEIRDLKKGEGIALSEAVKAMRTIAQDVSSLENTVDGLSETVAQNSEEANRYLRYFLGAIFVLVAAVISLVALVAGAVVL